MSAIETKWTPGPWERSGTTVYASEHHGWFKGVETFQNRFYAGVQANDTTPVEEKEANAQLMVSAPDLYAAMALVLPNIPHKYECMAVNETEDWAEKGSVSFTKCVCERAVIQAALAKARGEV